jgi:hypothetical protein
MTSTQWTCLTPTSPNYLLIPQNADLMPEYAAAWSATQMFSTYASTVTTARNDFSMAYDPQALKDRINDLRDGTLDNETLRSRFPALKDVSYWNLPSARKELASIPNVGDFVRPYCYRPFDFRFVYYHPAICERLRTEVMAHMKDSNIAFLTHRPQSPGAFTFAYCTRMIGDQCVAANKTAGGGNSFQFPLYLYGGGKTHLFDNDDTENGRRPNLSPEFIADFAARLGMEFVADGKGDRQTTFGPEDVFAYMYAVFHAPAYRERYAEFLKTDFPRLPLTRNPDLFRSLCELGDELVSLHLLEKSGTQLPSYPVAGDNLIENVRYAPPASDGTPGRVWINSTQYFEGVTPEIWEFHVGGYQVAAKWLKDRKGRTLAYDDLLHYQRTLAALAETLRLMDAIDATINAAGGWPLA